MVWWKSRWRVGDNWTEAMRPDVEICNGRRPTKQESRLQESKPKDITLLHPIENSRLAVGRPVLQDKRSVCVQDSHIYHEYSLVSRVEPESGALELQG